MRLLCALCTAAALGCVSVPHGTASDDVAPVPATFRVSSLEPGARRAYDLLRSARRFESPHVGVAGVASAYASAFRVLARSPSARAAFLALFRDGSRAGRLYAACGLYFADPPSFDAAVAELASEGGSVDTVDGCIVGEDRVTELVRAPGGRHVAVPAGQTLGDVLTRDQGRIDIAGGYVPLRLLDDDDAMPAPRGPALP